MVLQYFNGVYEVPYYHIALASSSLGNPICIRTGTNTFVGDCRFQHDPRQRYGTSTIRGILVVQYEYLFGAKTAGKQGSSSRTELGVQLVIWTSGQHDDDHRHRGGIRRGGIGTDVLSSDQRNKCSATILSSARRRSPGLEHSTAFLRSCSIILH